MNWTESMTYAVRRTRWRKQNTKTISERKSDYVIWRFFALRRETKKRQLSLRERMESTRSCFRERKRRKGKCRRDLSSIPVIKIWKEIIYGSERIRFSRNFKLVVADHETKRHAYATLLRVSRRGVTIIFDVVARERLRIMNACQS